MYDSRETPERYHVEVRENGRRLSVDSLSDPFINTTVRPRGWRVALAVLRKRYEISVHVGADREVVEWVSELDNNYTGGRGSARRAEWDAQLQGALGDFAARIAESTDD